MQARGFMGLTCPAGGGRNTLPIMGAMGSVEGLGKGCRKRAMFSAFPCPLAVGRGLAG